MIVVEASSRGRRSVFRNALTTRLYGLGLLIPTGICIGYAVLAAAVAVKIVFAVCGAGGVFLTARMLRAGIVVRSDGVRVRGLLRDREIAWDQVAGFGFSPGSPLNSTVYIGVELVGGSRIRTTGLTAASKSGESGPRKIAAMEALRPRRS
jgi:hypothetical protein